MDSSSLFVLITKYIAIHPQLAPPLPIFRGGEGENAYAHHKEKICLIFQDANGHIDLMRMKLFPLTLNDHAKPWLITLKAKKIQNLIGCRLPSFTSSFVLIEPMVSKEKSWISWIRRGNFFLLAGIGLRRLLVHVHTMILTTLWWDDTSNEAIS